MLVNSRDLPVVCSALYLLPDLRLSLLLWAIHVVFKTKTKKDGVFFRIVQSLVGFSCLLFFFTYGDYNPNREKDSV